MNVLSTRIKGSNIAYSTRHMKQGTSNINFTAIKNQYLNFENRITELENKLNEKDTVITSLLEKITNLEEKIENSELGDVTAITDRLLVAEQNAKTAIAITENHGPRISTLEQKMVDVDVRLDELESVNNVDTSGLETRLTTLETTVDDVYNRTIDYNKGVVLCNEKNVTYGMNIKKILFHVFTDEMLNFGE